MLLSLDVCLVGDQTDSDTHSWQAMRSVDTRELNAEINNVLATSVMETSSVLDVGATDDLDSTGEVANEITQQSNEEQQGDRGKPSSKSQSQEPTTTELEPGNEPDVQDENEKSSQGDGAANDNESVEPSQDVSNEEIHELKRRCKELEDREVWRQQEWKQFEQKQEQKFKKERGLLQNQVSKMTENNGA